MSDAVRVEIGGKPLRCRHCGIDVFQYEDVRLEPARIGGFSGSGGQWGLFTSIYVCRGCGFVHPFAEADGVRHDRTPTAADVERIECMSCGKQIPADMQRCPACGWSWVTEQAEAR